MSPLFGKKKAAGKTVLLVDVENGSVGAALARLSREDAPRLFAETRVALPFMHTRNAEALSRNVEQALEQALSRVSEVAARVRGHETLGPHGEVERSALFFSPPWAAMHLTGGTADFVPHMRDTASALVESIFDTRPLSHHPFGTAVAHGTIALFPHTEPTIVCLVSHEATELLLIANGSLAGHATVPMGSQAFIRTLVSHGGVSPHEAHSLMRLAARGTAHPLTEPLTAAAAHFANELTDTVQELLSHTPATRLLVVSSELAAEPVARTLAAHEPLAELFPEGTTVQAVRAYHVQPLLAAHAPKPDLPLMLEALFADAKFGIY